MIMATGKLARRPLYKPERKKGRKRGVLGTEAPAGAPDATPHEIITSICVVAKQLGIKIGQGGEYDRQRDVYVVVGKKGRWLTPKDYAIPGYLVAGVINQWRIVMRDAGPQDPRAWLQKKGYLETPKLEVPESATQATPGASPDPAPPLA
jgi:hypothetical protein